LHASAFANGLLAQWLSGTVIVFTIVCPDRPGGNVDTWLYLTAANRSSLGVEAFVSYYVQEEPLFEEYDGAQASTNPWRLEIPLLWLEPYTAGDGSPNSHRMLTIRKSTYSGGGVFYRNEVFLYSYVRGGWDLFYQFDYVSDAAQQRGGFVGWSGPIVETFQPLYIGTHPLGFKKTLMAHADATGRGSDWSLLKPAQSFVRTDNFGFEVRNIAKNFAFTVIS
jgi:hypothetical protein